jgi:uncharacterized protein
MDRRKFLATAGAMGAAVILSRGMEGNAGAEAAAVKGVMPRRVLGKTGVSVPIIGLGGSLDWTTNPALLRMAFQMGVTLWDTGNGYGNGKSEAGYGQFFSKYPEDRKKVILFVKGSGVRTDAAGLSDDLNTALEQLKTSYIDVFGLPGLQDPSALTPEVKAWAEQKKKEGKIKFFGFSTHNNMAKMLMKASKLGWVDMVVASYNYQLVSRDKELKNAVDACYKNGVGIIAMKSQGSKFSKLSLSRYLPDDLSIVNHFMEKGYTLEQAKLKVVWENEKISSCLSHITSMSILKDNIAAATDTVKLSSDDIRMLDKHADINRSLYCRGCMSCESAMETQCMIPDILRYMMYYNSYGERDRARGLFREIPESVRNALAAKDYSPAEQACPNRIEIGRAMKEAASLLV